MNVNIAETISVVTSIVAVGGVIIAYMRSISNSIDKLFDKLDKKVDIPQCTLDRANCPCVIEVKGLIKSCIDLSHRVDTLDDKHTELEKAVAIHHDRYEKKTTTRQ